jgi:hypothetical protein
MQMKRCRWFIGLLALLLAGGLLGGCTAGGKPVAEVGIAPNITYQVAPSAQVTKVAYFFKEYKGAERLHMELTVKNLADVQKRFRVHIFLPEGPAGGGFYPMKVKGDVKGIKPGEEMTQAFPMYYNQLPSGFTIVVKELG